MLPKFLCNCPRVVWNAGDEYKDATYMYPTNVKLSGECIHCGYTAYKDYSYGEVKTDFKKGAKGAPEYRQFEKAKRTTVGDWHKKDKSHAK